MALKLLQNTCFFMLLLQTYVDFTTESEESERLVNAPGHLKPFGFSEKHMAIQETDGFLFPKDFVPNYVIESKPLLMKNAAKLSKAFTAWTDDYFLNGVDEPEHSKVMIEGRKKEDRNAQPRYLKFKEFVRIYNSTDEYMVNKVPSFLAQDVAIPGPLQCDVLMDAFIDTVMWFSSGGTKSVVHTDSVDNINCLFRGEKTLFMVDPDKYGNKVDLDRPEGSYSAMDVDSVDFTKYPGMAEVEFYKVQMSPGDCLYIPYKWIHQVRSTGSNLAVNVWWDHHKGKEVDLDKCPDNFDPDLTLDQVTVKGMDDSEMDISVGVRDHFLDLTEKTSLDFEGIVKMMDIPGDENVASESGQEYLVPLRKIFDILDLDKNGVVTNEEVERMSEEEVYQLGTYALEFNKLTEGFQGAIDDDAEYSDEGVDSMDVKDEL